MERWQGREEERKERKERKKERRKKGRNQKWLENKNKKLGIRTEWREIIFIESSAIPQLLALTMVIDLNDR